VALQQSLLVETRRWWSVLGDLVLDVAFGLIASDAVVDFEPTQIRSVEAGLETAIIVKRRHSFPSQENDSGI
jgi:hypothetical protein